MNLEDYKKYHGDIKLGKYIANGNFIFYVLKLSPTCIFYSYEGQTEEYECFYREWRDHCKSYIHCPTYKFIMKKPKPLAQSKKYRHNKTLYSSDIFV